MLMDAKILNPICIKLGKTSNVLLVSDNDDSEKSNEVYDLVPGIMFKGDHYGFILIVDYNGKQKEFVYLTQCKIDAVGLNNGHLNIFEEGKKKAWKFDKTGKLEKSAFDDFTDEFRSKFDIIVENYDMFMGEPTLKNPISIKIALNPEESVILKDESSDKDYPLYPGAMIGTEHYGFILKFDSEEGEKEVIYPTQNRIDAIGTDEDFYGDLKIFEKGKYNPWLFTFDGKFKNKSSYNQYSRKDKDFVDDCYQLNEEESECFKLQKKK